MKQSMKSQPAKKNNPKAQNFYIAGLGASTGGLDAFLQCIESLPEQPNAAFIFILHLDPKHKSMLPELLRHKAKMPVIAAENKMPVKVNSIYVIPENKKLTIVDNTFILKPRKIESPPHAIDYFFESLAKHNGSKAIGVVLSGTGSDGTEGCRLIKQEGGITFAQNDTAKYDGMPSHAIESGVIDYILTPAAISKKIVSIVNKGNTAETDKERGETQVEIEKILKMMGPLGVDFRNYKRETVQRRILRRMQHHKIADLAEYFSFLQENDDEVQHLFAGMLINVTAFFREPELYTLLPEKIFPSILKNKKPEDAVRIWIVGSATGEEAYSVAICLLEYLEDNNIQTDPQIFVTDVSEAMIDKARRGIYTKKSIANVSEKRLARFFTKSNENYSVNKQIRNICFFSKHNAIKDPPFSRLDIISCQNLLIYFEPVLQKTALQAFHFGLNYSGYLILGSSESVAAAPELFEKLPYKSKIFRRKNVPARLNIGYPFRSNTGTSVQKNTVNPKKENRIDEEIEKKADNLLLTKYVSASVLINSEMEIIHFRGPISDFLQPTLGKASLSILKMLNAELVLAVRSILKEAKLSAHPVKKEGVQIKQEGLLRELTIEVFPFSSDTSQTYYLILFLFQNSKQVHNHPSIRKDAKDHRILLLESAIKESQEHIDSLTQELQSTNEESLSSNEELQTINEELQTINEELQTSKEELQSTNEELTTINEELNAINAELKDTRDYSDAIVWTLHEPLVVLNSALCVLNANSAFYTTFNVTPKETEGISFYKLGTHQWNIPLLRKLLINILKKKKNVENFEVTGTFPSIGKKTMLINARKLVRKSGKEELILLAIQDITSRIEIENKLIESEHRFRMLLQNGFDIITIFSGDGTIQYQSPSVEQILGYKPKDRIGTNIYNEDIIHPQDRTAKIEMIQRCISNPKEMIKAEFRMRHANGSWVHVEAICQNLLKDPSIKGLVANYRDITQRKMLENQKDEFIGIASHELKTPVTSIKAYAQILQEQFAETGDIKTGEMLNRMVTQVDKLTELIVDLLDVTKITEGQLQLNKKYFDLNKLLGEVVEEIQRTTEKHTLIKQFGKTIEIFADRYRIGQVLTNLLSNAIKYSPDSNKIMITSKITKRNITVCVHDYGIGIPKEIQHRIFERFFRMEDFPGKTYPGIGLGLYIASEIIHKSGGEIFVKSEKNKGSVFCFTLPVK